MAASLIISPFSAVADSLPGGTHYLCDDVKLEPLTDELKISITEYLDGIDEVDRAWRSKIADQIIRNLKDEHGVSMDDLLKQILKSKK